VRWTYSSYGDRCFAAAGPKLWNNLPAHLRQTDIKFKTVKTAAEEIFVQMLRARRIVANC